MNKRLRIRNSQAVEDARKLIQAGANRELVLVFMRDRGFDQADCVYAIQDLYTINSSEAKNIVFLSQAWSDQYESNKKLREVAREAMRLLTESSTPDFRIIFDDKIE